jgi:hypothetical protein
MSNANIAPMGDGALTNNLNYSNSNSNILYQKPPMNNVIQQLKKVLPMPPLLPANGINNSTNQFFINQTNSTATNNNNNNNNQQHMIYDEYFHNSSFVFNGINRPTPMLDNAPAKFKSSLIKRGSLASRQLPLHQQLQQQILTNQFGMKPSYPDQER